MSQRPVSRAPAGACRSRRADAPAMGSLILWAIIVPPAPPPGTVDARFAPRACCRAHLPFSGTRVARNVRLADMNLDVPVADTRRIEVVANGLPLWHGSQLAVDATIVSPFTRQGRAHPRAHVQPGSAINAAARRKRNNTHPELRRCRLVVVGTEVGGRFGTEVVQFLRLLARHRAAAVPRLSRPAANIAWVACWSGLIAVAMQRAFAAFLLELPPVTDLGDGPGPELHELLAEARYCNAHLPPDYRALHADVKGV